MFTKKKIKVKPILSIALYSDNETPIYKGPLLDLPLREDLIIEKSIQFFNDSNPCFLHRSAVIKRLLCEIEDGLGMLTSEGEVTYSWDKLPDHLKYLLAEEGHIKEIVLRWEERGERIKKL